MMRGRLLPLALLMLFAAMPLFLWLAAAGIVLITLRKGSFDGALALLASIIAAAVPILLSDSSVQLSELTELGHRLGSDVDLRHFAAVHHLQFQNDLVVLVLAYISANLLRVTVNLEVTLLTACMLVVAVLVTGVIPLERWLDLFSAQFELMQQKLSEVYSDQFEVLTADNKSVLLNYMVGQYLSLTLIAQTLTALLVGRWWQARLFNPGGFGEAFRKLSYRWPVATLLIVMMLMLEHFDPTMVGVSWLFLVPLVMVGLAILHTYCVQRKGSYRGVLAVFYLLLPLTYTLVAIVGWFDAVFDLRSRLLRQKGGDVK